MAAHTLFIHIEGPDGKIASQLDAQPRGGIYPTNIWDPGEVVRERYTVPIAGLPPGEYKVYIGWYTLPGGQRLEALAGSQPVPDNRVLMATFQR